VSPESPPLTAFLEALQLFAEAFDTGGGFRLLRIARPPILFYGLYGIGGLTETEETLVELVRLRGRLAEQLDCLLQCDCSPQQIPCQVILDKLLYDVDRAIDLYAVGVDEFSEPERRAAAYSLLINTVLMPLIKDQPSPCFTAPGLLPQAVRVTLTRIADLLWPDLPVRNSEILGLRYFVDNQAWPKKQNVVRPQDLNKFFDPPPPAPPLTSIDIVTFILEIRQEFVDDPAAQKRATLPQSLETTINLMRQELCTQKDAESRWENLVRTMAPTCLGIDNVFNEMNNVLDTALDALGGACEPFTISLPPHFETSLDSIADDVDRLGGGRPSPFTLWRTT
jgi:hypothetical protein